MTLDQISLVEVITIFGTTTNKVTLVDTTIVFVPNDPDNRDYPVVQEWLRLNP